MCIDAVRRVAACAGFNGTNADWVCEFVALCTQHDDDAGNGIGEELFFQLLNGETGYRGPYPDQPVLNKRGTVIGRKQQWQLAAMAFVEAARAAAEARPLALPLPVPAAAGDVGLVAGESHSAEETHGGAVVVAPRHRRRRNKGVDAAENNREPPSWLRTAGAACAAGGTDAFATWAERTRCGAVGQRAKQKGPRGSVCGCRCSH